MKLTAMDITSKEFKKGFRGYDMDEVNEYLDKIAEDYELLTKENLYLSDNVNSMREKLNHYSKMEETIKKTLILAQNAADQSRKAAQQEADMIIKNSNAAAQKILDKAHDEVLKINDEFEKTKQDFSIFRTKFKNFIQSQLEMFENMETEFIKDYNVGFAVKEIDSINEGEQLKESENNALELEEIEEVEEVGEIENIIDKNSIDEVKNFFVR